MSQVKNEEGTKGALDNENLDHLAKTATAAADMTTEITDASILSRILSKTSDTSTYDPTTDSQEMLSDKLGGYSGDGGAAQDDSAKASMDLAHTDLDAILADTGTDGVVLGSKVTAFGRLAGETQVIEVSITAAANAGVTTVATITTQPCLIKSVVIHADAAQTGDMTTCALEGGVGQVVEFIGVGTATQANLDAADKQVDFTGAKRLAATKVISVDLQGTGATAVDLTVTIEYEACVDGGYLV